MNGREALKDGVVQWVQKQVVNPMVGRQIRHGVGAGQRALLETTGRVSGQPRITPIGNGLIGDTFWMVTEHGHSAQYVRNLEADPPVRVCIPGRWRTGTAHPLPPTAPIPRRRSLPSTN